MHDAHARFRALMARRPVFLAPMEDVSDAPFRRICRRLGADVCVTEFVRAEMLNRGDRRARRKITLDADAAATTAIQIYGADPDALVAAARAAADAGPAFVDINCGCWVPRVAGRGAGAGWLRDPAAMVAMAARIVAAVPLPVTVKTRIGWGPESHMPIVDLARRLEDAGVAALTIHCRTAQQGHAGAADWQWARRAREVVAIPVVVNGDVRSSDDVRRALDETGCAAVMVGRGAIDHPWIFREARALVDHGVRVPPPAARERCELYLELAAANVAQRGEHFGVRVTRRHLRGLVGGLVSAATLSALFRCETVSGCAELLREPAEAAA